VTTRTKQVWIAVGLALAVVLVFRCCWVSWQRERGSQTERAGFTLTGRVAPTGDSTMTVYPITIDQPGPYYMGSPITFTATYDKDARRGNRTPQFPYHPQAQANLTQNGRTLGYWIGDAEQNAQSVTNNHDGTWTAAGIGPIPLSVPLGWDTTKPGTIGFVIANVRQNKDGYPVWTTYASWEFAIEASQ